MNLENNLSFDLILDTDLDSAIQKVTDELKTEGFGILTRIDFDQKIKEKLGHCLPRSVILGACNPTIAFEAYKINPDMLLLVPCNVVLEEKAKNKISARFIKPSAMLKALDSQTMAPFAAQADQMLLKAVKKLT